MRYGSRFGPCVGGGGRRLCLFAGFVGFFGRVVGGGGVLLAPLVPARPDVRGGLGVDVDIDGEPVIELLEISAPLGKDEG